MNLDLTNKNALVCGSSKGLGKASAIELALLGANVTLVSRSAELMSDIMHELSCKGSQHHDFLVADFTNKEDLKRKIRGLVAAKNIHILINNTGGPKGGEILNADEVEFINAFNKHLINNHLLVRFVLPGMRESNYGRIINIISTSVKQPIPNLGVSNTIRAAVANWSKTLANELAPEGITVNNLLPGSTSTERLNQIIAAESESSGLALEVIRKKWLNRIPMKRFGKVEEIGGVIAFLASPAASYITGTNITVDGGKTQSL